MRALKSAISNALSRIHEKPNVASSSPPDLASKPRSALDAGDHDHPFGSPAITTQRAVTLGFACRPHERIAFFEDVRLQIIEQCAGEHAQEILGND